MSKVMMLKILHHATKLLILNVGFESESVSFISYLNLECVGLVNHKKFKEVLALLRFEPPPCSDMSAQDLRKYFPSYSLTFLASIKVSFTIK